MTQMLKIALFAALVCSAWAAIAADEVTSLPGWQGALPTKQYSGYFTVGQQKNIHLHYWFAFSENNPTTDPVVLWLNGGPGSSSLIGFFTENGPFNLNDDSFVPPNPNPNLLKNPYSWNTVANMLYLESPGEVGFSYCDVQSDCHFTDTTTAQVNYDALVAFFQGFPEFASNPFYITGESYAGIYIPTLVQQINLQDTQKKINLKGMAIGDGCIGKKVGTCSDEGLKITAAFLAGQGFISQRLYSDMQLTCYDWQKPNPACKDLVKQMNAEAGSYDIYNIYDTCGNDQFETAEHFVQTESGAFRHRDFLDNIVGAPHAGGFVADARKTGRVASRNSAEQLFGGALNDYPCGAEAAMNKYLAQPSVWNATHVRTNVPHFQFNYTRNVDSLLPDYPGFIAQMRVLIYSGNVDGCIPFVGTEEWVRGLGIPELKKWHPWVATTQYGVQVGGYVTDYVSNHGFSFLTVKGSGHMVPQFKPLYALAMFTRFINGQPY